MVQKRGRIGQKAAKELGIESVRVLIEDISEDNIPGYMVNIKLQQKQKNLKPGQIAALVVRLYYEEERRESEKRMKAGVTLTSMDGEAKCGGAKFCISGRQK